MLPSLLLVGRALVTMRDLRRVSGGFGTIEVLIAISVFAVVLVALTGLMVGSISAGSTAEAFSVASNLARQRVDQLADDIRRTGTTGSYPSSIVVGGRTYTFSLTPTDLANNIVNLLLTVSYQVSYGSACSGGTQSCTANVRTYTRSMETRARRPGAGP